MSSNVTWIVLVNGRPQYTPVTANSALWTRIPQLTTTGYGFGQGGFGQGGFGGGQTQSGVGQTVWTQEFDK